MPRRLIPHAMRGVSIAKRIVDVLLAVVAIVIALPLLGLAAIGIKLSSKGPLLYPARRIGLNGRPFTMFKFRTMHHAPAAAGPRITRGHDTRVFPFGALLRQTKIDELPQLFNIVRGEMSFVGPRPEDPLIVARHYGVTGRATLSVRPGLTSPGTLYHDSHCGPLLDAPDIERVYVERILPTKLALDLIYLHDWTLFYDLQLILRTVGHIIAVVLGRAHRDVLPEIARARAEHLLPSRPGGLPAGLIAPLLLVAALLGCDVQSQPLVRDSWLHDSTETILVGAGDIADCTHQQDSATAALMDSIPGIVFTTGDNVYPHGSLDDFQRCYGPTWGRHLARTRPALGNHDYETPGAAGYFAYFGERAGARDEGYYSYRAGEWLVLVLNSEAPIGDGSRQLAWLAGVLAAADTKCSLAYMHRPRFSSGDAHGSDDSLRALWDVLDAAGVELVLAGHEHSYERFAPMAPDGALDSLHGIREIVVGTGGGRMHGFDAAAPNSEVRRHDSHGVLAVRLLPDAYEWRFLTTSRRHFTDHGFERCHAPRGRS